MTTPAKPVGPYSPVVRAGDWVITSGQLGLDGSTLVEGGIAGQTKQAMANVAARLAEQGAALTDVVKTLCILTDLADFAAFNAAYVEAFGDHRPARSTLQGGLVLGACVEIEAWAYKPLA
jgi:2-iminobutanoate/2-iminopropanoate deaminase